MNQDDLKHLIEATLLAAGRPVTSARLLELFDERERPTQEQLEAAFQALSSDYESRGIEVVEVASGWRIQVRPRYADIVSRLWQERPSRYSRALLETLALIAYRQPITRSEIEEIRGVSISSTIMRTLQERGWIRTVGHREVPGRPELLGTTREFLDYFGLKSLEQLPTLAELKDVETIGVQLELPADAQAGASDEAASATEAADVTAAPDLTEQASIAALDVADPAAAVAPGVVGGESAAAPDANAGHILSDAAPPLSIPAPDVAGPSSVAGLAEIGREVGQEIGYAETSDDIGVAGREASDEVIPETEVSDAPEGYLGPAADAGASVGSGDVAADLAADAASVNEADPAAAADDAHDADDADGAADEDDADDDSRQDAPTLVAGSDAADGGRAIGDPPRSS